MTKFAVPVVLDKTEGHLTAFASMRRTPHKVFLVEAESAKKAANAVKRHCEANGIAVVRIDDGIETETLPITVVVTTRKPAKTKVG